MGGTALFEGGMFNKNPMVIQFLKIYCLKFNFRVKIYNWISHKIGWYDYLMWYGNLYFLNGLGSTVILGGTSIKEDRV